MLMLSRKSGERILIDGQITITVVAIQGGRIRIGVEAPSDVSIKRCEFINRPNRLIATEGDQVRSLDHQDG